MRPPPLLLPLLGLAAAAAAQLPRCCSPGASYHPQLRACIGDNATTDDSAASTVSTDEASDSWTASLNATSSGEVEGESYDSGNISSYELEEFADNVDGTSLLLDPPVNDGGEEEWDIYDMEEDALNVTWWEDVVAVTAEDAEQPRGCREALVDLRGRAVELQGGDALLRGARFPAGSFCAEPGVLRVCADTDSYCRHHYCLPKCCPHGQSMDGGRACVDSPRGLSLRDNHSAPVDVALVHGHMSCKGKFALDTNKYPSSDAHWLERDASSLGHLVLVAPAFQYRLPLTRYCLEAVHLPPDLDGVYAFICFEDDAFLEKETSTKHRLESLGLVVSVACLGVTLAVYACLPTLQNLHGRTLMCHIAALLAAYSCLAVIKIFSEKLPLVACITFGVITFFSFLAAFSWLTVMCFDIWWTFGAVRSSHEGSRKRRSRRVFALYSLYAWGLPTLITAITGYLRHSGRIRGFSDENCFIKTGSPDYLQVFSTPVGAQLMVNVVLFALTARCCWKVRAELERMAPVATSRRRYRADLSKLLMNAKLFVVMGLTFTMEVVSTLAAGSPEWLWSVPDAVNVLQGVLISAVFILKRRVLRALGRRFGLKCMAGAGPATGTPTTGGGTVRSVTPASRRLTPASVSPGTPPPFSLKSTNSSPMLLASVSVNNHCAVATTNT